jgi:PIN domain nuclease of toxin-antitoxin system
LKLLLDTHALLWVLAAHSRLGRVAKRRIDDPHNEVWVSAASVWEFAIKLGRRRSFDMGVSTTQIIDEVTRLGFHHFAVTAEHGVAAGGLPYHHDDPFDRMLIAQAMTEDLTLVTADEQFSSYDVRTLAADA